jgi:hypothetical protein
MRITADLLNDHTADEETTTGATASAGFDVTDFIGRKVNGITTITITCNRTGADIPQGTTTTGAHGTGNMGDTSMATLPVGWRPQELIEAIWDSGFVDGGATINTSGVITLRTISGFGNAAGDGLDSGTNPRVTASWISENT